MGLPSLSMEQIGAWVEGEISARYPNHLVTACKITAEDDGQVRVEATLMVPTFTAQFYMDVTEKDATPGVQIGDRVATNRRLGPEHGLPVGWRLPKGWEGTVTSRSNERMAVAFAGSDLTFALKPEWLTVVRRR